MEAARPALTARRLASLHPGWWTLLQLCAWLAYLVAIVGVQAGLLPASARLPPLTLVWAVLLLWLWSVNALARLVITDGGDPQRSGLLFASPVIGVGASALLSLAGLPTEVVGIVEVVGILAYICVVWTTADALERADGHMIVAPTNKVARTAFLLFLGLPGVWLLDHRIRRILVATAA